MLCAACISPTFTFLRTASRQALMDDHRLSLNVTGSNARQNLGAKRVLSQA